MSNKTPSFIAEFPLKASPQAEQALAIRLEAARNGTSTTLASGEGLRRLDLMRQSKDWQRARAMKKSKERTELFQQTFAHLEFFASSLQKYAERCRDGCWIGDHLGSHDTQTTSLRAFRAVNNTPSESAAARISGPNRVHSIEGKGDAVIRFRTEPEPAVHWNGLVMRLRLGHRWTAIASLA